MYQIGNGMIIGITSGYRKGGNYLESSKSQGTKLVDHLPFPALRTTFLTFQGQQHSIIDCPSEVLKAWFEEYSEVENVKPKQWDDPFMRWRLVNFLIDDGALEVQDNMLVEVLTLEPVQEGA